MTTARAKSGVRRATDSSVVRIGARMGFAASGLLHILIGAIAVEIAATGGGGEADQSGALGQLASAPGGAIVLWIAFIGFAALGLLLLIEAFIPPRGDRRTRVSHFVSNFAKGVVYLVLAATALSFALGSGSSSAGSTGNASGGLLATPGGALLVALIGVIVFGVGIYLLVKGFSKRFTKDLLIPRGRVGAATVVLGVSGYVAKGVALGTVGVLFMIASVTGNAAQADGLDGALKALASLPLGMFILVIVGVGLIAYGAYSFVRARFAKL